jgi:hypothetical protein
LEALGRGFRRGFHQQNRAEQKESNGATRVKGYREAMEEDVGKKKRAAAVVQLDSSQFSFNLAYDRLAFNGLLFVFIWGAFKVQNTKTPPTPTPQPQGHIDMSKI